MISKAGCIFVCAGLFALVGCSDSTSQPKGIERFITGGGEFLEEGIHAGDGTTGFNDSWQVYFHKFLLNYHEIVVADAAGNVAAKLDKPRFVDNAKIGDDKELIKFSELDAKAYPQVSYQIKTAVESEELVFIADPADLAMMVQEGLSVYVEGEAIKRNPADPTQSIVKTFHWGFKTQTSYEDCVAVAENGVSTHGVVVTADKMDTSQLAVRGEHLFYDSLQSGENAQPTLRFAEKAAADDGPNGNGDGEISLQELCRENIDPDLYDAAGLPAATLGDFVISLARTIGEFRGSWTTGPMPVSKSTGQCTIKRIDPWPPGLNADSPPCAEYQ